MPAKEMFKQGLDLVFLHARPHALHSFDVGLRRNVRGALHDFDFLRTLDDAQFVHNRGWINDGTGRVNRLAVKRTHARDLTNDFVIEFGKDAEAIVKDARAIENLRQLCFKFRYRKGFVRAKFTFRTLHAETLAVPDFSLRIAWPHEEHIFLFATGSDDCD